MKTTRVILIAEDDEQAIVSWEQDIREFNRDGSQAIQFEAIFARSKRAAIRVLDRTRISCAVVDLRLPADDTTPSAGSTDPIGNDVLQRLLTEVGVPAVVYSGYTQQVSEVVTKSPIRVILKKKGGAMEALRWLASHESLMSAMEVTRTRIAGESAQLFTRSIWPRWEKVWTPGAGNVRAMTDMITRQTVSHVAEALGLPEAHFHPDEFYQIPPLDEGRLGTGDLTVVKEQVYVVVTPRCNLARDSYPNHLMLALCRPMPGIWSGMRDRFKGGDPKKVEAAAKELRQYATQGHATGSHFLPPCGDRGPWLADFKEIMTVPSGDVPALLGSRFASISSGFVPNLVQRYAAYLGRIGQPDLDCDVLRNGMCE